MRGSAVTLVPGNVETDRVVDVILDCVLLAGTYSLPVDLGLVGFGPKIPWVPRVSAILQ